MAKSRLMQLKVNHSKGKRSALNISGEDHGTLAKTTTTGGLCKDWPLWKEGHGFICDKWAEDPDYRCHWWDKSYEATKTHFQHEWIDKYDYHMTKPSQACCACGGGIAYGKQKGSAPPLVCKDWPLWKEGHGFTCDKWAEDPDYRCHWWDEGYEATKTHFQQGWIDKYDYHMTKPSQACCACGGGSTNSPPVAK